MPKEVQIERSRDEDEGDLRSWIAEAIEQGATRLSLEQRSDGSMIREWKLSGNDQAKLSEQILLRAEREGRTQAAVRVGFLVLAYRDADPMAKHIDRHPFFVAGGNAKTRSADGEEYSSGGGLERVTVELRRMVTELHRLMLSNQETYNDHSEKLIDGLRTENEKLRAERVRVWEVAERLSNQEEERALAKQALRAADKRDEFLFDKLNLLTPIAFNRFLGGGPGKGRPPLAEDILLTLLGSLKPEQIQNFTANSGLSPEQGALFAELYTAYATLHEAKQKQRKELNGTSAPAEPPEGKGQPS